MLSLTKRLQQARKLDRHQYLEEAGKRIGALRAGNSGISDEEGNIAGACARVAHLRQLGVELEEPSYSKLIMFERGYDSEDMITKDLEKTLGPDEKILRETEIPTRWQTKSGTWVTGRPDIVLC